jgi:hypothetical protein
MSGVADKNKIDITDNEIDAGLRSPRWDVSQERAFLENLLGTRFNFLLVFFSIFVAGAVRAEGRLQLAVLLVGTMIAFCLMLTIRRTHYKLEFILSCLRRNTRHPVAHTEAEVSGRPKLKTGRKFIGIYVPLICFSALSTWSVYAFLALLGCLPKLN